MNNGLIAHDSLNPENISLTDYTNTLAMEALRVGLLDETDIARIQTGLMETLSEVIGYYSGSKSTSIQTDKAKVFGQSILFNVDPRRPSRGHRRTAEQKTERTLRQRLSHQQPAVRAGEGSLGPRTVYETERRLRGVQQDPRREAEELFRGLRPALHGAQQGIHHARRIRHPRCVPD